MDYGPLGQQRCSGANSIPWSGERGAATYQVLHCHPDDLWPQILADRRARLGEEFELWYDQAGNLKPDVPGKKPAPVYEPDERVERAINERLAAVIMFLRTA